MKRNASSLRWATGTAAVCLVVLIGSWLLVLGPRLDAAAATRAQAADVHTQNDALRAQVEALRAEYAHLDEYKADLADLRIAMPQDAQLAELTREIDAAGAALGVTILSVSVDAEVALAGSVPAATTTETTAATANPSAEAPAAAPAPDPAAAAAASAAAAGGVAAPPAPVNGMVAIPLGVRVMGGPDAVRAFLSRIQTGTFRQLLVTTLNVVGLDDAEGDDTRPPSVLGDIEAQIGVLAWVLLPDEAAASSDPATAEAMPTGSNPGAFTPSGAVTPEQQAAADAAATTETVTRAATEAATQAATEAATQAATEAAATAAAQAAAEAKAAAEAAAAAPVPPPVEVAPTEPVPTE